MQRTVDFPPPKTFLNVIRFTKVLFPGKRWVRQNGRKSSIRDIWSSELGRIAVFHPYASLLRNLVNCCFGSSSATVGGHSNTPVTLRWRA